MKRFIAALLALLVFPLLVSCATMLEMGSSTILSEYQSTFTTNGYRRVAPHAGVDFGGNYGSSVLAAADGKVMGVVNAPSGCGNGVTLMHGSFLSASMRYTTYCHLERPLVKAGQAVKRGEVIGLVGTSGNTSGVPHVHLELCSTYCGAGNPDGNLEGTEDPLKVSDGCFDPLKAYPVDKLVLTYPVKCKAKQVKP